MHFIINFALFTIDPRHLLKWLFFLGCYTHLWFHSQTRKKRSRDDEFHDLVMSESPFVREDSESCSSFAYNFLEFQTFVARCNSGYITEKSLNDAKFITWTRLVSCFEEIATCFQETPVIT